MASKQDAPRRKRQKVRATKKLEKWREKKADEAPKKKKPAAKKG
jgi:hypothetical protein